MSWRFIRSLPRSTRLYTTRNTFLSAVTVATVATPLDSLLWELSAEWEHTSVTPAACARVWTYFLCFFSRSWLRLCWPSRWSLVSCSSAVSRWVFFFSCWTFRCDSSLSACRSLICATTKHVRLLNLLVKGFFFSTHDRCGKLSKDLTEGWCHLNFSHFFHSPSCMKQLIKMWVFCTLIIQYIQSHRTNQEWDFYSSSLITTFYKMLQTLNVYWPCGGRYLHAVKCRQIRNSYYWAFWPGPYYRQTHSSLVPWNLSPL